MVSKSDIKNLRPVPNFLGYYADDMGNIYSEMHCGGSIGDRGGIRKDGKLRIMRPVFWPNGYQFVAFRKDRKTFITGAHRVICATFNGPEPESDECMTVSHKNGKRNDNRASNLCWETQRENLSRKKEHGTFDGGWRNSRASFSKEQVEAIMEALDAGITASCVCRILGCDPRLIGKIKRHEHYKD